jgi:hypothetical protein
MRWQGSYFLLLVLCVLGDEEREALVDATFLEELFKFVLKAEVEGLELAGVLRTRTQA